ncbi:MAG: hypothetical protein Q4Q23_07400 [Methanobacteriaceae archaeon]|nr:hypothetical protein [Methanobacteriaceae archaeon]
MDTKYKAIIVVVILAIILAVTIPYYNSYQDNIRSENFNKSIQNANTIEETALNATKKLNEGNSTDVTVLLTTINNDIIPKYSEEITKLNQTAELTDDPVEKQYLTLQQERITLQSKSINDTVTILNSISKYMKGEKSAEDAQQTINQSNQDLSTMNTDIQTNYDNINKLLNDNPNLKQKVDNLNLGDGFKGKLTETTNNTTSNMTTSSV